MHTDPRPLAFVALLLLHGVTAAAPPREPSLAARARLAQGTARETSPAEELPPRPRGNPLRASPPAAPTPPPQPAAVAPPAGNGDQPPKGEASVASEAPGCRTPGCTSCSPRVPTCKPTWEDKKTKKASLAITCDFECVRPWEPYHDGACCEEKTTPCGEVRTKKKLFKTEEEKVERVLKYEVVMKPAAPCCEPSRSCCCVGCRSFGPTFARLFGWCH